MSFNYGLILLKYSPAQNRRKLFDLSENVGHHGWPTAKYCKTALVINCPKRVPKSRILSRKYMVKNLTLGVYLLISDFLVESLKANKN